MHLFDTIHKALTAERERLIQGCKQQLSTSGFTFWQYELLIIRYAWASSKEFVCGNVLGVGAVIAFAASVLGWFVSGSFDPVEQYTLIVSGTLIIGSLAINVVLAPYRILRNAGNSYQRQLEAIVGTEERPNLTISAESVNVVHRNKIILTITNNGADATFICEGKIVNSSHPGSQRTNVPLIAKWDSSTNRESKILHGLHDTIDIAGVTSATLGLDAITYGIVELKHNASNWFSNLTWHEGDNLCEFSRTIDHLRR